jgi:hypothetical protein
VRSVVRRAAARRYTFAALVEGIVMTAPFRQRSVPPEETPASERVAALPSNEEGR